MSAYFVTGTDTEVGKTYVTCQLLRAATEAGLISVGYKPVAAGCETISGQRANEDAVAIQQASSLSLGLDQINPITFDAPVAPHIAAAQTASPIGEQHIKDGYHALGAHSPDLLLMEGAGGWRLPISDTRYMSDVVRSLQLPVILVVGMRLGCLNHALLSAEAIINDGLHLHGWVANGLSETMPVYAENLLYLKSAMPAPLLAEIPFRHTPARTTMASFLEQVV
ncbi:dethiobiotin synthase [Alteromonas halophila]|uniref:ATP-dependent dethiobiotin synthetase BioD n=1 Tax=Alteromonas halophila TaxID=516698 RepID=A0A918JFF2_9ALTE|nr:dethiobiotin synthase [Alteromonas halophila]GGW75133.1 ATP-dependent dethiobiotin synthetase BioD [Alteromonas halophila]